MHRLAFYSKLHNLSEFIAANVCDENGRLFVVQIVTQNLKLAELEINKISSASEITRDGFNCLHVQE